MKTVRYVPLVNHLGRTFMAAPTPFPVPKGAPPPPAAVLASLQGDFEAGEGTRPAIVVSDSAEGATADLVVFKRQGDPSVGALAETSQHVTSVPFDAKGAPGTYHFAEETTPPPLQAGEFDGLTVAMLHELAGANAVEVPHGAKKADLVAALTKAGIKAGA